jgi:molybdopterin-guanine dinucleotide biosynthesis protein A
MFVPIVGRNVTIVTDLYRGKGPLAGIHAALTNARSECSWVVGCDMPFLSADAAGHMLNKLQHMKLDAVVPRLDGRLHPLHGVYRSACAKQIAELLEAGTYRVTELFGKIRWESVHDEEFAGQGIDLRFAVNTNTPEEWADALRMKGGEDVS